MNIKYNFDYYENISPNELVNYILCYLVYISTFFIDIKLININITFSLILLCFLNILSIIISTQISKLKIFNNDILCFQIIYLGFNALFLLRLFFKMGSGISTKWGTILFILITLSIAIENLIILKNIIKIDIFSTKIKFVFLIIFNTVTIFIFVIIFACIYINLTNIAIQNYSNINFKYNESSKMYEMNEKYCPDNYLSYDNNPNHSKNIFLSDYKYFTKEQVITITSLLFNNINKIEDYLLFSVSNQLFGSQNFIFPIGSLIKYIIIFQKIVSFFVLIILIHIICELKKS